MYLRAFSAPILTLVQLITACSNHTQKTNVRVMPGNDKSAEADDLLGAASIPARPASRPLRMWLSRRKQNGWFRPDPALVRCLQDGYEASSWFLLSGHR